ncbi:hypothetical protein M2145_001682 [Lachnospiraceae bacterium PF1-21]|uniref:hypothetical protein n=1 Tax=Ohessyouella blattaphilus TaxID=2949333 RepID=UPI003E20E44C
MNEERFAMMFVGLYLVVIVVLMLGGLLSYILKGVGLYTLGKRRGLENPWLAFIPYARTYFQGELCGPLKVAKKEMKHPGLWMILLPIFGSIISGIFVAIVYAILLGSLLGLAGSTRMTDPNAWASYLGGHMVILLLVMYVLLILVNLIIGGINSALTALVNRRIYSAFTTDTHAVFHGVMGLFIPLYTAIYLFMIRNREANGTAV